MKYMVAELMFKAEKAWYKSGRIHLLLSDKKEVSFPVELNSKLKKATEDQLRNVAVICNGIGLHWPDIDEDLTVTGILEGRFGTHE
jgi:predicted RNase H-like nuclease